MFNQKKEQKKMKKFWNLMLAALVIIGAAACTENYDGVEKAEGFSFYAEVVNGTRATIEKDGSEWKTVWNGGEELIVNGTYTFTCTDAATGKFTCYDADAANLAGTAVTITTNGKHNSYEGQNAFYTTASVENFGTDKVELQALTSFFRFNYSGESDLTLTLTEAVFKSDANTNVSSITVKPSAEEQFVAFWPTGNEVTFSYSINGIECKSATKAFKAGMVYNMGECNDKFVYLKPNAWYTGEGKEWFAAHFWNSANQSADVTLTKVSDGLYGCAIPAGMTHVIFCRMNPKYAEFKWNSGDSSDNRPVWNRTYEFGIVDAPYNCHYVTKWGNGFANDSAAICPSIWGETSIVASSVNAWGVIGSMTNNWNQEMKYPMVKGADGKLIARSVVLYKNDEFKVSNGNSWAPASNVKITADGVYDITCTTSGGSVKATKVQ